MKTSMFLLTTLLLGLLVPLAAADTSVCQSSTCASAGVEPGDCTGATPSPESEQCIGVRQAHTNDWTCVGSYVHARNGVLDCTGVLVWQGRVYVLWTRVA